MITRVFLILAMIVTLLIPLWCTAEGIQGESNEQDMKNTTGYILERARDNSFIQVGDRNYRVGIVEILAEKGHPQQAGRADIQDKDIVHVIPGAKSVDSFWYAEKITIYRGALREEIAQGLEQSFAGKMADAPQTSTGNKTDTSSSSAQQHRQEKIIFENGVWHN